jgi:teichuronic acid biosynthesis glycosyltransferase TuaC
MRVLFVTNVDVLRFGVAEVLRGLSTALVNAGVRVLCYGCDASVRTGRLPNGVPTYWGPLPKPRLLSSARDVEPLIDLCRRQPIDLIHCHQIYRPGWAARLVQRAVGIPFVATSHGDVNRAGSARIRRWTVRWRCRQILHAAAAVTHFNSFMYESIQAIADVANKSHLIPNGIDLASWQRPVERLGGTYLLTLGRLVSTKGLATLIAALAKLKHEGRPLDLVLAGEGDAFADLQEQARAAGLPLCTRAELSAPSGNRVCFPGMVHGEAKRSLVAGAWAVAYPSHPESPEAAPVVPLEAMAAGKVVLASDIASVRNLFQHAPIQLMAPRCVESWVCGVRRFLTDPGLLLHVEEANRNRAREYSWDAIGARYREVYELVTRSERVSGAGRRRPVREAP